MTTIKCFFRNKLGIDKAIAYSSGSRIAQAITGPLSVLFIAKYLTGVEQGFFYTFGSLLAVQIFLELGLSGIITQFVAHEACKLQLHGIEYEGLQEVRSRLASLLHFSVKWYGIISVFALCLLILIGYVFFSSYETEGETVDWLIPWVIVCIATSIKLFQSPIMAFVQGLGLVKEVNKVMFYQQLVLPSITWIGLALDCKLYVIGVSSLLSVLVWEVYCQSTKISCMLKKIWETPINERVSYLGELFPMQWRIAISWIGGYFTFQLFNPVLFATEGAVVAGRMGMTMTVLNALQAFTQSWINTKVPVLSGLIAQKRYVELDSLFSKTMNQMLGIGVAILFLFLFVIGLIQYFEWCPFGVDIGNRFLPFIPSLLLSWSIFTMFPINCWATYLRCHKKEPLMWNSIVVACLCCSSTLILGNCYGLYGMVIGFSILRFISITWVYLVYKKKKYEWHK